MTEDFPDAGWAGEDEGFASRYPERQAVQGRPA